MGESGGHIHPTVEETMRSFFTTLSDELGRMEQIVTERARDFVPPVMPGASVAEVVTKVLLKHSRDKMAAAEQANLSRVVQSAVDAGRPIAVSMMLAVGGHGRTRYKFCQPQVALPRLGDLWTIFWFKILNQKIQRVYAPGLEVVLVDEVPHLRAFGWQETDIEQRKAPLRVVAEHCAPFVRIVNLPDLTSQVSLPLCDPPPGVVYAVVASLPEADALPLSVFRWQYQSRDKPWDEIRSAIPSDLWEKARAAAALASRYGEARKHVDWLGRDVFGGQPYIDACVTEKGRWAPDIWSFAFPQHGGTVLRTAPGTTQFSVCIEPESRLVYNDHDAVYIQPADVAGSTSTFNPDPYIFYWIPRVA